MSKVIMEEKKLSTGHAITHDSVDEHGEYKKRCFCQKCVSKYDHWCKKHKEEGHQRCKRMCRTVCTIKCEKPVHKTIHWGYKEDYEGKWEEHKGDRAPKNCHRCQKGAKECNCK